jgi:hypothetical protein
MEQRWGYVAIYLLTLVGGLAGLGGVMAAIDPLWYFGGNRLIPRNLPFDERQSKTNQLQHREPQPNCLILGSSTALKLNGELFQRHRCFNYAFSAGRVEEMALYAARSQRLGLEPQVVYVGIDDFNFSDDFIQGWDTQDLQQRLRAATEPVPPVYRAYGSWSVLGFALESTFWPQRRIGRDRHYYDAQLNARPVATLPTYRPHLTQPDRPYRCHTAKKLPFYQAIATTFPQAKIVGFVPPRSAWATLNRLHRTGLTACYGDAIAAIARTYDQVYDFALPTSPISRNPTLTPDGIHYQPHVQAYVASVLDGRQPAELPLVQRVSGDRPERYADIWLESLKLTRADLQPPPPTAFQEAVPSGGSVRSVRSVGSVPSGGSVRSGGSVGSVRSGGSVGLVQIEDPPVRPPTLPRNHGLGMTPRWAGGS